MIYAYTYVLLVLIFITCLICVIFFVIFPTHVASCTCIFCSIDLFSVQRAILSQKSHFSLFLHTIIVIYFSFQNF
eukprot:UN00392